MIEKFTAVLSEKVFLTPNVCLFRFQTTNNKQLVYTAGQYLIVNIPKADVVVKRLYSIACAPTKTNVFELIIEFISNGVGSEYFSQLNTGKVVEFEGPAGVFTLKESGKDKVFLVTGTGIAPVRSMILEKFKTQTLRIGGQNSKFKINVFWGLPRFENVYLLEELKNLSQVNPNFLFKICLSRETNLWNIKPENQKYFSLGHINNCLENNIFNNFEFRISDFEFYLCGGRQVVDSLRNSLFSVSIPKKNIFFEKF